MKNLDVPYLNQLNNMYDPYGACNVTAIAMCLRYRGIMGDGSLLQLEDQVWERSQKINANRFAPDGIRQIILSYNRKDILLLNGRLKDIRNSIDKDGPVIAHGYATEPGHIFVIKGYDLPNKQFIVHDPYGEPFFGETPWRYDTNKGVQMKGKELRFSEKAIASVCSAWSKAQAQQLYFDPDFIPEDASSMWLHSILP